MTGKSSRDGYSKSYLAKEYPGLNRTRSKSSNVFGAYADAAKAKGYLQSDGSLNPSALSIYGGRADLWGADTAEARASNSEAINRMKVDLMLGTSTGRVLGVTSTHADKLKATTAKVAAAPMPDFSNIPKSERMAAVKKLLKKPDKE